MLILVVSVYSAPAHALYDLNAAPIGDFSILQFLPESIAPGYPLYALEKGQWSLYTSVAWFTEQELLMNPAGRQIRRTTMEIIRDMDTGYDKAKAIYEWLIRHIDYDLALYGAITNRLDPLQNSHFNWNQDPTVIFADRVAICEGFSRLAVLMLYFADIPSAWIFGMSGGNRMVPHGWNACLVEGRWIYFDASWRQFDMPHDFHRNVFGFAFSDGYLGMVRFVKPDSGAPYLSAMVNVPEGATDVTLPKGYAYTIVK